MFRPNVSLIVHRADSGKFLLVHKPRLHHAWQFPQGGVEDGESLREAGKRELIEEIGTDAFTIMGESVHVYFYKFPTGETRDGFEGHKQKYLWVRFTGEEESIHINTGELDNFRWVYEEELGKYLESPQYLERIKKVISEMNTL
jgi:putative (di)nucleoside polyphosphate hydrolase